jgi:hypothetical protein
MVSADQQAMIEFKGSYFKRDVIRRAVRWYVAYPIGYRQLEEMMNSLARQTRYTFVGIACPPGKFATEPGNEARRRSGRRDIC